MFSKIDLSGRQAGSLDEGDAIAFAISTRSGAGMDALREHLKLCMGYRSGVSGNFSARRRHLDALRRADEHLDMAESQLGAGRGELLAEELRLAQQQLSSITGEFSSDDLLGEIFAGFCIGK